MDPPVFFTHRQDTQTRLFGRGEMEMAHFGEGVANCVINRPFADFPALYMRDWNSQSKGDRRRREHLIAVGDK